MTEQNTEAPATTPKRADLEQLLTDIPSGRWLAIRKVLQMPTDDIMTDTVASMVVAANETVRADTGRDDWDRLLAMPLDGLNKVLGLSDDTEGGDASKSDPAPVGDVHPGPVGDTGVADGVVGDPGAVVPADGPVTG